MPLYSKQSPNTMELMTLKTVELLWKVGSMLVPGRLARVEREEDWGSRTQLMAV